MTWLSAALVALIVCVIALILFANGLPKLDWAHSRRCFWGFLSENDVKWRCDPSPRERKVMTVSASWTPRSVSLMTFLRLDRLRPASAGRS